MKRKTVNLSDREASGLEPFLSGAGPEREALARFVGEQAPRYRSESAALRELVLAGAKVIRQQMQDEGYRELAKSYTAEDRAITKAAIKMAAKTWRD